MKCIALVFLSCLAFAAEARQPNIVFILADDLGYGDLGCYGQTKIKTPHLDRMASEGVRLTQHYSGNAVCAPSRCVLMTGLHPGHAFIRDNRQMAGAKEMAKAGGKPASEGQHPIPTETVLIPELLKSLGYATGGFGKWGLGGPGSTGEPLKQGFDRWFGYNSQSVAHNFYPTYLWDNDKTIELNNPAFSPHDKLRPDEDPTQPESYKRFQGSQYSADLIAEAALKFARDHKDQPFFLYWPTTVPHLALQVPDDSLKDYAGLWEDPPYPGGRGYTPHFKPRAAYAAMVTRMDREVGRLMKLIEELGLDQDTLFVFTSDNGPLYDRLGGTDCDFFNSNGGLRGRKGSLYEGGFRVPGVIRWKGKIQPAVSERVTAFEDWMPTLLELVGASDKLPAERDGISFAPTLMGKPQEERPFLYREFPNYGGQQCVRIGAWKGVRQDLQPRGKKAKAKPNLHLELYELSRDPLEQKDVSAEHPEIVAQMLALMKAQHRVSEDFPFPAIDQP